MRRILILFLFGVLLNFSTAAQNLSAEIQELRDSYIEALKNSDTKAILKIYANDAMVHHIDGSILEGSKEIGDFYDSFFESSKATIDFNNVSTDRLAKDLVFYHDEVYLNIEGEDMRKIEVINIAEKRNGQWRVTKSYRWPMPQKQ